MGRALPYLNAVRQSYGLPKVRNTYDQWLGADQILVLTSPEFDFTSPHMPAKVSYVGPELTDPHWAEAWHSPFTAGDNRPLVLVGLSSMFQNQMAVLRRIILALSRLPVRGLVTLGPALSPTEVPGSENVVVVRSAPHSKVLEQASVVITHCGHGTTIKSLAAGVPLLCMPHNHDQPDTAARVVHRGAGLRIKMDASPAQISSAVERLLSEPSYRENARRLQKAIQTRQGCADAVELLLKLAARESVRTRPV